MNNTEFMNRFVYPSAALLIGALVAGLSAVLKTWFQNRDIRQMRELQLELATSRTEFIEKWVAVARSLGDDHEETTKLALGELNEAFRDAQRAFDDRELDGRRSKSEAFVHELRYLLMFEPRQNAASYVVSFFFYISVAFWWLGSLPSGDASQDPYSTVWAGVIGATVSTIVMRVFAGLWVGWLEHRARSRKIVAAAAPTSPEAESAIFEWPPGSALTEGP